MTKDAPQWKRTEKEDERCDGEIERCFSKENGNNRNWISDSLLAQVQKEERNKLLEPVRHILKEWLTAYDKSSGYMVAKHLLSYEENSAREEK